jgi:hypothetical protein
MPRFSEHVRALTAEADRRHEEIERDLEEKVRALLGGGGQAPSVDRRPQREARERAQLRAAAPVARKGETAEHVRAFFADGETHKLQDVMVALGKTRAATYAALNRLRDRGEIISLGSGLYRWSDVSLDEPPAQGLLAANGASSTTTEGGDDRG